MALIACLVFMLGLPSLSSANAHHTKPRSCPVTYPVSASDVMSRVDVATSSTFSSVPRDFVSLVYTWCSEPPVENNHFNLTFSEPVLITSVIIASGSGAPLFVSEFSLLYQENATDTFRLYKQFSANTNASNSQVFSVGNLTALRVQFLIHSAVLTTASNDPFYCWHTNVLGCRLSEVDLMEKVAECSLVTTSSSLLMSLSPSSPTPSNCPCQTNSGLANLMRPLIIVPPFAVLLLLLLISCVIIAVMAVLLCRAKRHSKTNTTTMDDSKQQRCYSFTVQNTELYTAAGSLPTYETVKGPNDHEEELTDNPMYGQTQFSINGSFDRLTSDLSLYPKEENKYTQ